MRKREIMFTASTFIPFLINKSAIPCIYAPQKDLNFNNTYFGNSLFVFTCIKYSKVSLIS